MKSKIDEFRLQCTFLKEDQVVSAQQEVQEESRSTLPQQRFADLIVYPESQEDVQNIVRLAKQLKISIWYVSTGKNWGYGCRAASYSGGITMILERMKKIYEVNPQLGYAVIEPGVTYHDLNEYLKNNNLPLWTDCAGTTKFASIIGNALDKGRGLTPYADHFGMLCGIDVVLPDGSYLESSPVPNYQSKYTYKWGRGPYLDGMFTQSNFGIVVKSGVWLMPKPEKFVFFAFEYEASPGQFAKFITDFRALFFSQGMLSRPHLANDFAMLCIVDQYPSELLSDGETRLSAKALQTWKQRHGIGDWTFGGGLYGTKRQISAQKELVKRYLSPYGIIRFMSDSESLSFWGSIYQSLVIKIAKLTGKSDEFTKQIFPALELFKGTPTDDFAKQVYFKSKSRPSGKSFSPSKDDLGFIWIGPLVPFSSEHVEIVLSKAKQIFEKFQFDFFVELIVESPRNLIALFGIFYDTHNQKEIQRAERWYEEIYQVMESAGYSAYRSTSTSSEKALDGNIALKDFLAKLKKSVDEDEILAPGRYGIHAEK